jgi:predicted secreted hydrolase
MFYTLRNRDGSASEYSAGTWTDAAGDAHHLGRDDVVIEITDYWESERGGRYPSAWEITVPGRDLAISVVPVLENQELITNVRYWEGAVDIKGDSGDQPIGGRGYVELTGYAN